MKRRSSRDSSVDAASILLSLASAADGAVKEERPSTSPWSHAGLASRDLPPPAGSRSPAHWTGFTAGVKAPRTNSRTVTPPTRSYVWRGPRSAGGRLSTAAAAAEQVPASADMSHSSSDDDAASRPGHKPSHDKEWAALTTWLRMNLHHPRTLKKLVLFVGVQDPTTGRWAFGLNPGLAWHDVSLETKMRLKTLPQETEAAFALKYPGRPAGAWTLKTQKYRVPGSGVTAVVPLSEIVHSLRDIFVRHEATAAAAAAAAASDAPCDPTTPQPPPPTPLRHPAPSTASVQLPRARHGPPCGAGAALQQAQPHGDRRVGAAAGRVLGDASVDGCAAAAASPHGTHVAIAACG